MEVISEISTKSLPRLKQAYDICHIFMTNLESILNHNLAFSHKTDYQRAKENGSKQVDLVCKRITDTDRAFVFDTKATLLQPYVPAI